MDHSETLMARLKRITEELRVVQQVLVLDAIDARVLLDFREAVDHVRETAWGVQQFIELREGREDPFSALTFLAEHRIRRARQLCRDVAMDLDSTEIGSDTPGLAELKREAGNLVVRLGSVLPAER